MSAEVQRTGDKNLMARLELAFRSQMPIPPGVEPNLSAALQKTLGQPGSLFRAELAFRVAIVYGLEAHQAECLGISLEYFHTASLIFDDLPSMDDAVYRRGAVCIHQLYGEGTAILCALALINRAYALVWKAMEGTSRENAALASETVERYLGLQGILDGQSRDIHFGVSAKQAGNAQQIALEKTASLIRLPLVLPAILGGAPLAERQLLLRLAKFWGLGYQALDDLKDILKQPQEVGKSTRRDELLQRPNVALELGTERAMARIRRLSAISRTLAKRIEYVHPELSILRDVGRRFEAETSAVLDETESRSCCFSS